MFSFMNLTHQEIFDKVADHLFTQKCKCTKDNVCLYRGDDGTKCAAGCLITDEEYKPAMERKSISALMIPPPQSIEYGENSNPTTMVGLVQKLQHIHDGYHINYGDWNTYMNKELSLLAERAGLKFTTRKV